MRVRKVAKDGKMKAVVSITLDDEFVVHDIKVIEGEKGLFIAMPSRKASDGEYILLLNDDIKVYRAEWLSLLVGQASLDYAGAVGAKLLYPETDIIQHIGIANLKIGPSHSEIGFSDSNIYYFGRNRVNYNWLAVTAACLMVKKSKYEEVGGLDEELTVAYNDVDFCFKLYERAITTACGMMFQCIIMNLSAVALMMWMRKSSRDC